VTGVLEGEDTVDAKSTFLTWSINSVASEYPVKFFREGFDCIFGFLLVNTIGVPLVITTAYFSS